MKLGIVLFVCVLCIVENAASNYTGCYGLYGRLRMKKYEYFKIPEICTQFTCIGNNTLVMGDICRLSFRGAPKDILEMKLQSLVKDIKSGNACQKD